MKKVLMLFIVMLLSLAAVKAGSSVTFEDGIKENTPLMVLITAPWVDNASEIQSTFIELAESNTNHYNYSIVDISNASAKEFNKSFMIHMNLPYVMLFKDQGKISRLVNRDCIETSSCFSDKIKFFLK